MRRVLTISLFLIVYSHPLWAQSKYYKDFDLFSLTGVSPILVTGNEMFFVELVSNKNGTETIKSYLKYNWMKKHVVAQFALKRNGDTTFMDFGSGKVQVGYGSPIPKKVSMSSSGIAIGDTAVKRTIQRNKWILLTILTRLDSNRVNITRMNLPIDKNSKELLELTELRNYSIFNKLSKYASFIEEGICNLESDPLLTWETIKGEKRYRFPVKQSDFQDHPKTFFWLNEIGKL